MFPIAIVLYKVYVMVKQLCPICLYPLSFVCPEKRRCYDDALTMLFIVKYFLELRSLFIYYEKATKIWRKI